ncbi:33 kDa ribonucleoprotein, chloroplastic-like [Solanum dulcamara]|uniref:33 kDa ribonucleoprotein, chloroplastic-like n=1 Tax=Solanum dulcamara TaxID=45834 RepID=UPI002486B6DC|nr:33 kDa ribonucleoprotein, chloroplastic-like [Solanum dulcamara]
MSAFSSSSSCSSLHFFTQKPKFSVVKHISLSTSNTHFNFKINNSVKPIKPKPHFPTSSNFSFLNRFSIHFSASALSDGAEVVELDDEVELSAEEDIEEDEEKEGDGSVDQPQSIEDGRLYVGNLPFSMTPSQLSEIFAEAGKVANVEIVYDRVTDRSRGFAFVTMGSVEEAKEAVRLFDGSQVGGRTVKVNFPEVPRGGEREVMSAKIRSTYQGFVDSPHKLYVANLSWNLTSQGLKDAFADQTGFLSAKVIYDRASGRSRGFGFITFSSAEAMNNALDTMNEVDLEGRPLRLNLAGQRAPVSSPPVVETSPENDSENSEILSSLGS